MSPQDILDSITDPFFVVEDQLVVSSCNAAAASLLQRHRRLLIGKMLSDVLLDAQWPALKAHCVQALNQKKTIVFETCFRPGSNALWLEVNIYPLPAGIFILCHEITHRKPSEEALRQSEAFLNTILEKSPHSMWISDGKGTLLRTNQALRDLLQVTDEELVGKYCLFKDEVVQEQRLMPKVQEVFEQGKTVRFQISYDSSKIQHLKLARTKSAVLDVTISPILDADQKVCCAIVQHLDVTELKRAETILRASEERYRRLFESVNDAVFLRPIAQEGTGGNFIEVNQVACQRLGYTREELLMKSPADIDPCTNLEEIRKRVRQFRAGEGLVFETVHLTRDGRRIPVEISSHLLMWEGQEMILSVARDLTERKASEAALRESERRLCEMMENVRLASVMLNSDSRILFVNQFLLDLTGWAEEEVMGKSWFEIFIPPELAAVVRKAFDQGMAGMPLPHFENEIITRHGERRLIRWNNTTLKEASGRITGIASIGEDITEHRRLEEQLRQAQKMEAIGVLAGGVAHDFNNILGAMMLHINLIQSDPCLAHEAKASLDELSAGAQRAANLTRQLLLFSRKQILDAKPLDLLAVIHDLIKMLRRIIGEDIDLAFHREEEHYWIQADVSMMEQVLMNLCVNARDAMPNGGRLAILIRRLEWKMELLKDHPEGRPGRFVCLSVSDTGCGMSPATLKRVFEPFFTTKEVGKGTGLGLTTVYGIVKQHQGWVEAESALGQGSTFRVYLPELDGSAPITSTSSESTPMQGGTETILLVEDELPVRRVLALRLRKLGYTVFEAADGIEAFQIWTNQQPRIDLLFTDMVMPQGITGFDLAERLRKDKPALKVILSSGYSTETIKLTSLGDHGIRFLPKPYDGLKLARSVRDCLDDRR